MKLLLDSDIIVALVKEDDSNHKRAIALFKKYKKASLYISQFCIPEVSTVLSYRLSQHAAAEFLKSARKRELNEIFINKEISLLADSIFISQKNKGTSWIDCCNVALMKRESFDALASFDKFYSKQGFKVIN